MVAKGPAAASESSRATPGAGDGQLVARARAGDERALRSLYDRWRPSVFRVARSFDHLDRDEVEDVVQDTFVRAFQRLDSLAESARFGPWILTIARNRALTRLARRRKAADLADELAREAAVQCEEAAAAPAPSREAELEVVRTVISELPEGPEKETVRLYYVEGNASTREIAARFGVGKSAITMRLERFRAKVKRRLLAQMARLRGEESQG